MVRLFIIIFVRFFITVLVIYTALTLLKKIIQAFHGHSHPPPDTYRQEDKPKSKEEYKDVKDAKFVELPKKPSEENKNSQI